MWQEFEFAVRKKRTTNRAIATYHTGESQVRENKTHTQKNCQTTTTGKSLHLSEGSVPRSRNLSWGDDQTFYEFPSATPPDSLSFFLIGSALRLSSLRQALCPWHPLAVCIGCNREHLQSPVELEKGLLPWRKTVLLKVVGPCFPDQPNFPWPSFIYSQLSSILV